MRALYFLGALLLMAALTACPAALKAPSAPEPEAEVPVAESNTVQAAASQRLSGFKVVGYDWNVIAYRMPDEIPAPQIDRWGNELPFRVRVRIYHHSRSHGHGVGYRFNRVIEPANLPDAGEVGTVDIRSHWKGDNSDRKMLDYTLAYTSAYIEGGFGKRGTTFRRSYSATRKARTQICAHHWSEKRQRWGTRTGYPRLQFQPWNGEIMASWARPYPGVNEIRAAWQTGGVGQQVVLPAGQNWSVGNKSTFTIWLYTHWTDYRGNVRTCTRFRGAVPADIGSR